MKIISVKISNYRNLSGIEINFNSDSNYIIGENNLGKSNLLDILEIVLNGKKFDEDDYFNEQFNIEMVLKLKLEDYEKGYFGDNFSPDNSNEISLLYKQNINDSFPTVTCLDTDETIPIKSIKKIHYIRYSSTDSPMKELKISSPNTAGKVFSGISKIYFQDESNKNDFLNQETLAIFSDYVNDKLSCIKGFSQYGIKATVLQKQNDIMSNLFYFWDEVRQLETTGSGIQYITMASLNVLSQIMTLFNKRTVNIKEHISYDKDGRKLLPIIVALDEPEVHLHPYLQRSLIKYYKSILDNKDEEFIRLLKECFDIDGLDGQLIIVTHSPDVLVDDYRNIIRFYRINEKTDVVSWDSSNVKFSSSVEKQLIMKFRDLREAFYAHCVILFEGETEYGCIPYFAEKLGISLDDNCICAIHGHGESNIQYLRQLLDYFKIPSVAIYDGDVKGDRVSGVNQEYYTNEPCLEVEIVKSLFKNGKVKLIKTISKEINSQVETVMDSNYVKKEFKKINRSLDGYKPKKLIEIEDSKAIDFCDFNSIWWMKTKGVLTGRLIGDLVPRDSIPKCYTDTLYEAVEIANGNK